jgi:short subunit dehydrogenase-like uncharacterized protein
MKNGKILIYGANGYTGGLFAKHLLSKGIRPILAARSSKVERVGKELNCETRIFNIENAEDYLSDIDVLANLAGPFSITQSDLIKSCLRSKTHYVDIAGEYAEMANAFRFNDEARRVGTVILPAAGFGVVPTDIAAKLACSKIKNPISLEIAYATNGGASRGTLKTVLKDIQKSGHILENGEYKIAKPAQSEIEVTVFKKRFKAVYNPWRADLYTAKISTGVDNIQTYSEFPGFVVSMMKGNHTWLRNLLLNRIINLLPEGPSDKQLKKGSTHIQAIAKNKKNEVARIEIKGPEAYIFTLICLDKMISLILENESKKGCLTPSELGTEWLGKINGVEVK